MVVINVDTISGEIRRTSPDKSDSSFTWPLPGFLLWLIWCKWALFYLCFPLFVPCCRVTNLWCERVELAWELYRDRYIIDMLNDAINSLEFFSFKFVCRIFATKVTDCDVYWFSPLLSDDNLKCQEMLDWMRVGPEQPKWKSNAPQLVCGCVICLSVWFWIVRRCIVTMSWVARWWNYCEISNNGQFCDYFLISVPLTLAKIFCAFCHRIYFLSCCL